MTAEHLATDNTPASLRKGSGRRLNGWKEIGAYFQKNERTVKRWEHRGLPVHRLPGGANTAVFAYADELETWLSSSRVLTKTATDTSPEPGVLEPDMGAESATDPEGARRFPFAALAAALAVVLALGVGATQLIRQPAKTGHQPPAEAAQLYFSGLYHWNTRTAEGLAQSVDEFHQAIALDPEYAAAYAGLGNAYNLLAQYDVMKGEKAYPLARAAAEKAIALDPDFADGYSALGFATFYGYHNFDRAEALFKKALKLDPRSSRTFHWYALISMHTGRFDAPLQAIAEAQSLDPDSHAVRANRGLILFYAGRADEAIAVLSDLARSVPTYVAPHYYLATIYLDQQRYEDYLRESLKAAAIDGNATVKAVFDAAEAGYRAGGAKAMFAAMLAVQQREHAAGRESAFNVARTAALLGDDEVALAALGESRDAREAELLGIRIDRAFKSLRGDPRFQKLADAVLKLP
jgi:tetratricopeptide (TPR) repeat protein